LPLFKRKGRIKITRKQLLSLKPRRKEGIEWTQYEDGSTVITYEHEPKGIGGKIISVLLAKPKKRKLILDEKGSFVWARLDGRNTLKDLISLFSREFKISRRRAEVSIIEFLARLEERGLIEVEVPEPE